MGWCAWASRAFWTERIEIVQTLARHGPGQIVDENSMRRKKWKEEVK